VLKRRHCILVVILAGSFVANADVGIGVSANADDATVYVPLTVGSFMLEPYARFADNDSSLVGRRSNPEVPGGIPTNTVSEGESYTIGMGIFHSTAPAERVSVYYGGRLAHTTGNTSSLSLLAPAGTLPAERDIDGNSITPAVGIQYHPIERFSVGVEIGWEFTEVDDVSVNAGPAGVPRTPTTRTVKARDTRADIVLRFFF
jgi:hypothetical protein